MSEIKTPSQPVAWSRWPMLLIATAILTLGAITAFNIYQDFNFVLGTFVLALIAFGLAVLGVTKNLSWRVLVLVALLVLLTVGFIFSYPSVFTNPAIFGQNYLDYLINSANSFRRLLTIPLPAGSFAGLFFPWAVVFFGIALTGYSLILRTERWSQAAIALVVPYLFGILFGSSAITGVMNLFGITIMAPVQLVTAMVLAALVVMLLRFGQRHQRLQKLRDSGIESTASTKHSLFSALKRSSLALVLLAVAIIAAVLAPNLVPNTERQVLREHIDPELVLQNQASPLSNFRQYFNSAAYNSQILRITEGTAQRLRIATLSYYDGESFKVAPPNQNDPASSFIRVPYRIGVDPNQSINRLGVQIGELSGVWLPTAGGLSTITFEGERAAQLNDAFFYLTGAQTGIVVESLSPGDSYFIEFVAEPSVTGTSAGAYATVLPESIPESVSLWIEAQGNVPRNLEGLQHLISLLRERGYLSHSQIELDAEGQSQPWLEGAAGEFVASNPGHNTARIDALFTDLLIVQQSSENLPNPNLVAAAGDDEQFVTAAAMIATELGIPSRAVLGFRLSEQVPGLANCVNGNCLGSDISAWLEAADSSGNWVAIDVTPQSENPIATIDSALRDPQVSTDTNLTNAEAEDPPAIPPTSGFQEDAEEAAGFDVRPVLRVTKAVLLVLIPLLVLLAPLIIIAFAKRRRAKNRANAENLQDRISGGWEELVDRSSDWGYEVPLNATRSEVAGELESERAVVLAAVADKAVFGPTEPSTAEAEWYWEQLKAEEQELSSATTLKQKILKTLSFRSYTRYFK